MNFLKQLQTLRKIDTLVNERATGSPSELAKYLGISRTSVFNYIKILKEVGAPISYSRRWKSYFYREPFNLEL